MPIEFACESCNRLLRVPDGSEGGQCECPACKTILEIPNPNHIANVGGEAASGSASQIKIACPKCSHSLRCDRSLLGTKGQCRKCQYIFLISENPGDVSGSSSPEAANPSGWTFTCPKCNQLFEGKEEMRGRKGKCHSCGEVFKIELKRAEQPTAPQTPQSTVENTPNKVQDKTPPSDPSRRPARPSSPTQPTPAPQTAAKAKPARKASSPTPQQAPIRIACPSCDGVMEVPGSAAGRNTTCPYCKQLLEIPAATSAAPAPEPTVELPAEELPEPAWSELGDLSGAFEESAGPLDNASSPYVPPAGEWAAPRTVRRSGLTFSNAFGLTFERAFPACLAGSLIYFLISGAAGLISWLLLFATSWGLKSAGFRPDSPTDMNIVWTVLIIAIVVVSLISILLVAVGFSIICNGALAVIRRKNYDSAELFSTGGAYMPMLVYLFVLTVVSAIPSLAMYGIMALAPSLAMVALLLALLLTFCVFLFYVATCMAPFAILDGENPIEAMAISMRITGANPLAVFGTVLCVYLIFVSLGMISCGVLAVLGIGFPFYAMAACYHLGTK